MKSDVSKMMAQGDSFGVSNIDNPFMTPPKVEAIDYEGKQNDKNRAISKNMVGSVEMGGVKTGITDLVEIYRQRLQNIKERITTPGRPQVQSLFMNRV
jgi:hypothetical protein